MRVIIQGMEPKKGLINACLSVTHRQLPASSGPVSHLRFSLIDCLNKFISPGAHRCCPLIFTHLNLPLHGREPCTCVSPGIFNSLICIYFFNKPSFFSSKARAVAPPIFLIFKLERAGAKKRLPRVLLRFLYTQVFSPVPLQMFRFQLLFFTSLHPSLARRHKITPFIMRRGKGGKIKSCVPLRDIITVLGIKFILT